MFSLFKKRKKNLDLDNLSPESIEDDKDERYQLTLSNYRDTSLAQNKEKSRSLLEKTSETDKLDV